MHANNVFLLGVSILLRPLQIFWELNGCHKKHLSSKPVSQAFQWRNLLCCGKFSGCIVSQKTYF